MGAENSAENSAGWAGSQGRLQVRCGRAVSEVGIWSGDTLFFAKWSQKSEADSGKRQGCELCSRGPVPKLTLTVACAHRSDVPGAQRGGGRTPMTQTTESAGLAL